MRVIASVACQSAEESIREDVDRRTESARNAMIERMQRAIDEGDFTVPVEAEPITRYVIAVMQGMAVQAGAGADREQLQQVADATLAVWPSR